MNEAIDICRRRRLITSLLRAPESSKQYINYFVEFSEYSIALDVHSSTNRSNGEIFIGEIHANNLPLISNQKHGLFNTRMKFKMKTSEFFLGNNPYCIMEMNHCQRQTTAVLCETSHFQWNIAFRFFVNAIVDDTIQCSIYNRSTYNTDRKILFAIVQS